MNVIQFVSICSQDHWLLLRSVQLLGRLLRCHVHGVPADFRSGRAEMEARRRTHRNQPRYVCWNNVSVFHLILKKEKKRKKTKEIERAAANERLQPRQDVYETR